MSVSNCECLMHTNEQPRCAQCYTQEDVRLLPARKNGHFIGQFFLCARCAAGLSSLEIEITGSGTSIPGQPIIAA